MAPELMIDLVRIAQAMVGPKQVDQAHVDRREDPDRSIDGHVWMGLPFLMAHRMPMGHRDQTALRRSTTLRLRMVPRKMVRPISMDLGRHMAPLPSGMKSPRGNFPATTRKRYHGDNLAGDDPGCQVMDLVLVAMGRRTANLAHGNRTMPDRTDLDRAKEARTIRGMVPMSERSSASWRC
jgi:hypothetical protein